MKKIIFVIDSLESGGAEKSLITLLRLVDYRKFNIDLLLFSKTGLYLEMIPKEIKVIDPPKYWEESKKSSIDLIKKRNFKFIKSRVMTSIMLRSKVKRKKFHPAQIIWDNAKNLVDKMEKEYDIAIAYSQGIPTYFVAEKIKANKKLCWVNTDYKKAGYNPRVDELYYKKFNNIVCVSKESRRIFKEIFPYTYKKIEIMYDIISSRMIQDMAEVGQGFKDDFKGFRILTIGRLVPIKGYDLAIEVARKLKKDSINFKWYIIGEGMLEEELKATIDKYELNNYFEFLGVTINPYTYLKECDLYIQPSRFEGFGMAIAEAKILNKVIVATNFDAVYNQIENNINGIITNINSEEIYCKVKELLENKDIKNKIIKNLEQEKKGNENEINKFYEMIV